MNIRELGNALIKCADKFGDKTFRIAQKIDPDRVMMWTTGPISTETQCFLIAEKSELVPNGIYQVIDDKRTGLKKLKPNRKRKSKGKKK